MKAASVTSTTVANGSAAAANNINGAHCAPPFYNNTRVLTREEQEMKDWTKELSATTNHLHR